MEISDLALTPPGFVAVTVQSACLRSRADVLIYRPEAAVRVFGAPLILLLHGVYGSSWSWAWKGGAHRTLERAIWLGQLGPSILAMPSDGLFGDGSGYTRRVDRDFEHWIVEETPAAAALAAPEITEASPRFIAGLSMGGYGALRLGAKHGAKFLAASGLSSATELADFAPWVEEPLDDWVCEPGDGSVLAAIMANRAALPRLRFDCGTDDPLLASNRRLHELLEKAAVPHEYAEHPGAHDWRYWSTRLADTFEFFGRVAAENRRP